MNCSHAGHVDPVDVNINTDPPEHPDDGVPVTLLDALVEDNLVREPHPSLTRMGAGKETGSSGHCLLNMFLISCF